MSTLSTDSGVRQQRTSYQALSPSVPYRQQAYHPSSSSLASTPHVIPANPSPTFTEEAATRTHLYSQTSHHFYRDSLEADDAASQTAVSRGLLLRTNDLDQPYSHSDSGSSDPPLSAGFADPNHLPYAASSGYPESRTVKRRAISDALDAFSLGDSYTNFRLESSAHVHPRSDLSHHPDYWPNNAPSVPQQEGPLKVKKRREKPRIELAPDQPPTTQGKPRARVYVACLQCRNRKIRCDGAKPVCHNCSRRTNSSSECNYDAVPKRRGPDKVPGARQRMARDARDGVDTTSSRRRRKTRTDAPSDAPEVPKQTSFHATFQDIDRSSGSAIHSDYTLEAPSGLGGNVGTVLPVFDYPPTSGPPSGIPQPEDDLVRILSNGKNVTSYVNGLATEAQILSEFPGDVARGYIAEIDEDGNERRSNTPDIRSEPSLNFSRKIWWDSLLSLYLSPTSTRLHSLTVSQRESASQGISADIRFIFRASNYWFSFFHIPSFFSNFFDPVRRERIQPSLVLALLAISTFWQSSEIGYGEAGRERALRFRDEAQAAMDASFNSGWIDETLAQAAWLLALFEVCAHPRHSSQRSTSSMLVLDSIIRSLSLTLVDSEDPNTTLFPPGTVPTVNTSENRRLSQRLYASETSTFHNGNGTTGCSCQTLKLQEHWPSAAEHTPLWSATPAWDESWPEGEIRKESCRRLCWSSMVLAAGHISYTTAQRSEGLDLFISDPANYALLFSGESVARSPTLTEYSSKDTIWALYDRSYLLWHGCIRMRKNHNATDDEKAQFAMKAWLEADSLEQALNRHTCSLERAFIFQAREYIFNTRMCISYEFQRYIPLVTANVSGLFHRQKAEEWLTHQATVAERFMLGLHTITGNAENLLARRPFFVFWFMGQIHRAISLWECDRSLTVALDVCKALIPATDYLTALWPCPEQRLRYESLHQRVVQCCLDAGLKPPTKIDLSLPAPASSEVLI